MPPTVFGIISFHFQWSEVWDDVHVRQGLFRQRRQLAKLLKRTSSICRENIFKCHYGFNYIKKGRQCRPGSLFLYYGCLGIVYSIGEALSISLWIYTVPWLCLWLVKLKASSHSSFFNLFFNFFKLTTMVGFTKGVFHLKAEIQFLFYSLHCGWTVMHLVVHKQLHITKIPHSSEQRQILVTFKFWERKKKFSFVLFKIF